jgi:hypothetical protein
MTKRYPAGPITPHGAYYLASGRYPALTLFAHDGSIRFDLQGGMSVADPTRPERVSIKRGGLKGLVAPWQFIDQKGATQDGVTFIDALNNPMEVTLTVVVRGRDPQHLQRVVSDLIAAIDTKRTAELAWLTPKMGRWWADVRWFKTPPDPYTVGESDVAVLTLILRADDGFWRSYDDVDSFGFDYLDDFDGFNFATSAGLGPKWDLEYSGDGGGVIYANAHQAAWQDDPDNPILPDGRSVVCRRNDYESATNNQVVEIRLGSFPEWSFPDNAYNDAWGRLDTSRPPGRNGVRLRIGVGWIRLSCFVSGHETVLRERPLLISPLWSEKFALVCGYEGDERLFKVLRNGTEIMSVKERSGGVQSMLGAAYRGAGFGMHAGQALITQATPAAVSWWKVADNSTVSQSGYVTRVNVGDQPMFDKYTLFGPGMFRLPYGPDTSDYVEFGPLLGNQVFWIDTDPNRFRIKDLTSIPPTPQELDIFRQAIKDFINFATGNNAPPLLQEIESWFGIEPPQGNPYSLLTGRWGTDSAIPAKSPGKPAKKYKLKVAIDDGNADSKIIVAGTPLRRFPL